MALSCLCLLVGKWCCEVRTAGFGVALPSPFCWAFPSHCWVRAHKEARQEKASAWWPASGPWNPCKGENRLWSSLLHVCGAVHIPAHTRTHTCTAYFPVNGLRALAESKQKWRSMWVISGILAFVLVYVFETVSRLSSKLSRG